MRLLLPLLVLAGCAGNDWEWEDTFDPNNIKQPGAKPEPDTDRPDPPPAQDCKWPVGSYTLTSAMCGDQAHGAWSSTYTTTNMVVTHNKVRGCDVVVTLQNDTCKEEITLWIDAEENPEDPSRVVYNPGFRDNPNDTKPYGVTACNPFECTWGGGHTCTLADHGSEMPVAVDQSDPQALKFEYFLAFAAPTCSNTLKLAFQKQ